MTERDAGWQQEAELLGLPIIESFVGAAIDPIIESFGPQRKQAPLLLHAESMSLSQDELLELAQWSLKFANKDKSAHVLKKLDTNLWTYRRLSWTQGPTWYPIPGPLHVILERI